MLLISTAFVVLISVILFYTARLLRRPGEGIGLPIVALLVFGFLYVAQPIYLLYVDAIHFFLTDWQIAKAVIVPAVMLVFFMLGWFRGTSHRNVLRFGYANWDPHRLWKSGLATAMCGLLLLLFFVRLSGGFESAFSGVHGEGLSFEETTAYLYKSPYWILSGLSMMIVSGARLRRSRWHLCISIGFGIILYCYAILVSSRGLTFATTATLLVSYALGKRARVSVAKVAPVWLAAGMLVLLILGYRGVLHLGGSLNDAPDLGAALKASLEIESTATLRQHTGREFIFHASVLDTVDTTKKCHFGIPWVYMFTVHVIPRIVWPEKPYNLYSPGITRDDITQVTGLRVAHGAAAGIVADAYTHFGPLSMVLFFLIGCASGRLFMRAQYPGSPIAISGYALLCALCLNAFAQSLGSILVSYTYAMAPVVLFCWLSRPVRRRMRTLSYRRGVHSILRGPIGSDASRQP